MNAFLKALCPSLLLMFAVSCSKDDDVQDSQSIAGDYPEGCLPGVFSVSETKTVKFSCGNLQYSNEGTHQCIDGSTKPGTWRFATHQYDIVGSPSYWGDGTNNLYPGNVSGSDNADASDTYTGWIDLFGWGTSGYHDESDEYNTCFLPYTRTDVYDEVNRDYNMYGYGPSVNMEDVNLTGKSAYYDWGVYNAISNGGNKVGKWRVLSNEEWTYLYKDRQDAGSKWGHATVNGVSGVVFLPDSWTLPKGCSFTPGNEQEYATNTYTVSQWEKMEQAGAVFLPAAGYWGGVTMRQVGNFGNYWSSTFYDCTFAYVLNIMNDYLCTFHYSRCYGNPVRLVCE